MGCVVTPNTCAIALALFTATIIGFGSAIAQEFHCGPADIYLSTTNDGHTIVNFKIKVGKTTRDKQYPVQFRSRICRRSRQLICGRDKLKILGILACPAC